VVFCAITEWAPLSWWQGLTCRLGLSSLQQQVRPDACRVEDFSVLHMMRRTKEGSRFFISRSSLEKLIVNLADSGWRDTIIWVCVARETVVQKNRDDVPIAWNKGTSSTVASQLRWGSKRGSNACSRSALTIATRAGFWIHAGLPFLQLSRVSGRHSFCSYN